MATRFPTDGAEIRAAVREVRAADGRRLEGWAALFDAPARIGNGVSSFMEVIRPGAFRDAIRSGSDVLALADHDPAKVLGRTRSGTLRLSEHSKGLAFSLDVPQTQVGQDLLFLAKRGDLGGMSFGFNVPDGGDVWEGRSRELLTVNLHEISVVSAFPAYAGTSVQARARCENVDPARERERFLASI